MPGNDDPADRPLRAKLFMNGRSQAVRLPKIFRFEGNEVEIRREGESVILAPVTRRSWPPDFFDELRANAHLFADLELPPPLPPGGTDVDLDVE